MSSESFSGQGPSTAVPTSRALRLGANDGQQVVTGDLSSFSSDNVAGS